VVRQLSVVGHESCTQPQQDVPNEGPLQDGPENGKGAPPELLPELPPELPPLLLPPESGQTPPSQVVRVTAWPPQAPAMASRAEATVPGQVQREPCMGP
jgi:hypothetical protein